MLNVKLPFTWKLRYDTTRFEINACVLTLFILLLLGTKMINEVSKKQFRLPVPKFTRSIINIVLQALLVTTFKVMIMPP